MLEGLKKNLNKIIDKLSKTELKGDQLDKILWDFKLALIENDVALSVTDKICDEVKSRLQGSEVKRFEDKKNIVKKALTETLSSILGTEGEIDLPKLIASKRQTKEPLIIVFVGINGTGKCVSGDASVPLLDAGMKPLKEIYDEVSKKGIEEAIDDGFIIENPELQVYSVNPETLIIEPKKIAAAWKLKAPDHLLKVTFKSGIESSIETTPEHPFFVLTKEGIVKVRADTLKLGDYIMTPAGRPNLVLTPKFQPPEPIPHVGSKIKFIREALRLKEEDVAKALKLDLSLFSKYETDEVRFPRTKLGEFLRLPMVNSATMNHILLGELRYLTTLAFSDVCWQGVKNVERAEAQPYVYDLTVDGHHNFIANNFVIHNTTTIGKVAHRLLKEHYSVVLSGSDTYRAGSIEQLEGHAKRLRVNLIKHTYGADAAAVAFDAINHAKAHGIDVVLIDTAGRMQTDRNLIDEMKKIVRVSKPDLVFLIVDALTGNDALEQSSVFDKAVGIDGVILTKLDADAKGGAAISMRYMIGKPVIFFGIGQRYEDLIPFSPDLILKNVLGE